MCRKAKQKQKQLPDCQDCEARCPEILPENEEAWILWCRANTQWRTSFSGLVGLDYTALEIIARTTGVSLTTDILEKIQILEAQVLHEQRRRN